MVQKFHPAITNYEPKISKEGLVKDSPFLNKLKISRNYANLQYRHWRWFNKWKSRGDSSDKHKREK